MLATNCLSDSVDFSHVYEFKRIVQHANFSINDFVVFEINI